MLSESAAAAGLPPNPHGDGLATVAIIMCIVAGLLVICRLYVRAFMANAVGWDDYTLLFGMVLAVGMTVCFNMEVYHGMRLHSVQLADHEEYKTLALTWLWVAQLLYKFANGITKISIALLYLRIFPSQRFCRTTWVFIAFVVAYCLAAILASILQCKPVRKAWEKDIEGECIDIGSVWYVNSAMTLTADAILIALPWSNIIRLQLPKGQKIALVFVFSLGVFVMACTVVRCVALGPTTSQDDIMYYQASSNSWTFLEIDVSIICASLPILHAPLGKIFPHLLGNKHSRAGPSGRRAEYEQWSNRMIPMQDRSAWQESGHAYTANARRKSGAADSDAASDEQRILGRDVIHKTFEVRLDSDAASAQIKAFDK